MQDRERARRVIGAVVVVTCPPRNEKLLTIIIAIGVGAHPMTEMATVRRGLCAYCPSVE